MDLKELKDKTDKAFQAGIVTRERAAGDMVFYYITQWDDNILSESQLAYRGEFDILKKAGRKILSDLALAKVQVDFEPKDTTKDDAAETIDGMYRSADKHNYAQEAYDTGKAEAVVCGAGAWLLYPEYEEMRGSNKKQVIKRKAIHEANNNLLWDPNAKRMDKSDANYVSLLESYSEEGYLDLVEELTGKRPPEFSAESFKQPEQSYAFPWLGGEAVKIYIVDFYHREKIKDNLLTLIDPFQRKLELYESELKKVEDELLEAGFEIVESKKATRWQVTKYIASGEKILKTEIIAGSYLPVVPIYGEHAFVEGEEHYEGVTRLAKDPQRLRNFQMSYLADITSQGPVSKPIFLKEQIAGFEYMYETSGIDNRFNYLLQNKKTPLGEDLPIGPIAVMPDQPIPEALVASIGLSREAVEDVANPGVPQNVADPDTSGKAVYALQAQIELQSVVYQLHFKHAKRRDAEIYADIASIIHDVPRDETIELPDGTKKTVKIMNSVMDEETGDIVVLNDLSSSIFDVTTKIGPDYGSQKEQTIDRIEKMVLLMDPNDPMRKAMQFKQIMLMDGVDFKDIREFARMQLILMGVTKPDTDEEKAMLQASKESAKEPDAAMVLAKAEELKGKADIMQEKREGIKMQLEDENEKSGQYIDVFKATTDRMKVQIEAQKAGATINKTDIDSVGSQLDNHAKILEMINPDIEKKDGEKKNKTKTKSDADLMQILRGA